MCPGSTPAARRASRCRSVTWLPSALLTRTYPTSIRASDPLILLCQFSIGRNWAMAPWASHSRRASSRSQSTTWRCAAASGSRRRSGRRGKSSARTTPPTLLLPLLPLPPHQVAVGQHHRHRMPVEPRPQPPLVLVPAQQALGLLVVPLHPVPSVGVLHHRQQGHPRPEVAPGVLPASLLGRRLALADQPAEVPPAVRGHAPAPQGREPAAQPTLAALPPADGVPGRTRQRLQQRLRPPTRLGPPTAADHREVTAGW